MKTSWFRWIKGVGVRSLKGKLSLAFSLLILVIAAAGGSSWFFYQ